MAAAIQQPGGPAPLQQPAALPPPANPHNFQRVVLVGADATLDYWACPAAAKMVGALPLLGWRDASSVLPGQMAAPGLSITAAVCAGAHFDWNAPAFQPTLLTSELLSGFDPAYASRAADALASVGLFDGVAYLRTDQYFAAYASVLPKMPAMSQLVKKKQT